MGGTKSSNLRPLSVFKQTQSPPSTNLWLVLSMLASMLPCIYALGMNSKSLIYIIRLKFGFKLVSPLHPCFTVDIKPVSGLSDPNSNSLIDSDWVKNWARRRRFLSEIENGWSAFSQHAYEYSRKNTSSFKNARSYLRLKLSKKPIQMDSNDGTFFRIKDLIVYGSERMLQPQDASRETEDRLLIWIDW